MNRSREKLKLTTGEPIPIPREAAASVDKQAVRAKAAKLIGDTSARLLEWSPPPFDPRIIAEGLGIPIHFTWDLKDVDALIVRRRGKFHILANAEVGNPGRLNFTIAHEIAHTFFCGAEEKIHLRARDRRVYDRTPEGRVVEQLCDLAAAELLMPSPYFEAIADELGFNASAVPRLAERFDVSLEAAAIRLLRTREHEPCAIGFFEFATRGSAGQRGVRAPGPNSEIASYRVRRLFRTHSFPFLLPRGKSVPRDSVIYRSSLARKILRADEDFAFRDASGRFRVSALPLHRDDGTEEPPLICAVLDAQSEVATGQ